MTFNDWLNEIEVYSSRAERLQCDFENAMDYPMFVKWLRAAYDVGKEGSFDFGYISGLMTAYEAAGYIAEDYMACRDPGVDGALTVESAIEQLIQNHGDTKDDPF